MTNTNETIADIVAEMRGPKFYPWGQGGFSVEMDLTPLADHLEAAWKREKATAEKSSAVGDSAKLREALEYVLHFDATDEAAMEDGLTDAERIAEYADHIKECQKKAIAALAAPPRNCDKFGTDNTEASLAYEEFCDRAEVEESVNGAIAWLLSLDADKKGGAK